MPRFRPKDAPPEVTSTPFSEFIRTASSEEEKKTPETSRKLGGDFAASPNYYGGRLLACGRVSVRGSHSILQGFQRAGSNFLSNLRFNV